MSIIHISPAEAASTFADLIAKVRTGAEVCIDEDARTIAVIRGPHGNESPRLLSEVLRGLADEGFNGLLDKQFSDDVEEGIRSHEHDRLMNPWESF